MGPSRKCRNVFRVLGVIAIVPLVGMIGLIVCELRQITLPAMYSRLVPSKSLAVSYAMIPTVTINLLAFITWPPLLIAFKYGHITSLVIFYLSGSCVIMAESLQVAEMKQVCLDDREAARYEFRDWFTYGINTEAYYDVLKMRYLTLTDDKEDMADAVAQWVTKRCMADYWFFIVFLAMTMVGYVGVMVMSVCLLDTECSGRDLFLNSEYRRVDGEVIHETIDISK